MPDRVLRAELLTSEAWLGLKNNDDRVCWIVLLLNADTLGNQPGGLNRLVHLWRHAGIDMPEKAAKVLVELVDVDLIRRYEDDGKPYLHVPVCAIYTGFIPFPLGQQTKKNNALEKIHRRITANHRGAPVNHR
jgi:hypothetical protein